MFYHLTLYPTALPSFTVDSRIGIDASEPSLDSSSGAPRGQGCPSIPGCTVKGLAPHWVSTKLNIHRTRWTQVTPRLHTQHTQDTLDTGHSKAPNSTHTGHAGHRSLQGSPFLSPTLHTHTPQHTCTLITFPANQLLLLNTRLLGMAPCLFQPPGQCLQPSWTESPVSLSVVFPLPRIHLLPSHFHKTYSSSLSSHEAIASFSRSWGALLFKPWL